MSLVSSAAPPHPTAAPTAQPSVVPARHPWRWISAAAVLVLVAQLVHGLATNPGWDWGTFAGYFLEKSVLSALLLTLELTFAGAVLGFLGGLVLAPVRLSP